jgi:hypothetical protein
MSPGYDRHGETGARLGVSHQTGLTGLNLADAASALNPCLLDIASLTATAQPLPH